MSPAWRPLSIALIGVAAGLLAASWGAKAWLGRWLDWDELAGVTLALGVGAVAWVRARRQRERRRLRDLRDSALW